MFRILNITNANSGLFFRSPSNQQSLHGDFDLYFCICCKMLKEKKFVIACFARFFPLHTRSQMV